jgi:hypothetical protein
MRRNGEEIKKRGMMRQWEGALREQEKEGS